jgi:ComF family protein
MSRSRRRIVAVATPPSAGRRHAGGVPLAPLVSPLAELFSPLAELFSPLAPPLCWACGAAARRCDALCRECHGRLRWLEGRSVALAGIEAWAPLAYEGPARALVAALKFRGAAGVAETMAAQVVACAPRELMDRRTLVAVPLHPRRQRQRGFNQAERLAAAIARRAALPRSACLARRGAALPQTGRGRSERLSGAGLDLRLRPGAAAPQRALLVDDVITTGATLSACAEALRRAGTENVAAVAYARTLGR